MSLLKNFKFTAKGDKAISLGNGWFIDSKSTVKLLAGSDVITGRGGRIAFTDTVLTIGVFNAGKILGLQGSDSIKGLGRIGDAVGVYNAGTIDLGEGNDRILANDGNVAVSLHNGVKGRPRDYGSIRLGNGDDAIVAYGIYWGIINYGTIDLGAGSDKIQAYGLNTCGLQNYGRVSAGSGNDIIDTSSVDNVSEIDMGSGNDKITGLSGIRNIGFINMGDGNDTIDALTGGFSGWSRYVGDFEEDGKYDMGKGDDVVKGFGDGTFMGGAGNDSIELPSGRYRIETADVSGFYDITFTYSEIVMRVNGFESFGSGASASDFMAAASAGYVIFA